VNFHEQALIHSSACLSLLHEGRLKDAMQYCCTCHIEPPHCLTSPDLSKSEQAQCEGIYQLGDYGWWLKRLKISAKRDVEKQKLKTEKV